MAPMELPPHWEGCPVFDEVWDHCATLEPSWPTRYQRYAAALLRLMPLARVVRVLAAQMDALPCETEFSMVAERGRRIALPFDPLFVDFGGLPMWHVEGVRLVATVVGIAGDQTSPTGRQIQAITLIRVRDHLYVAGAASPSPTEGGFGCVPALGSDECEPNGMAGDKFDEQGRACAAYGAERTIALLTLLESANVYLDDLPLSRQVRRATERRGGQIALTVHIRQSTRRARGGVGRHIEYAHRFETRGHYKYFPEGTRLADAKPEKLSWVPEKGAYMRRIWCPPFVKGPADKPLVPKIRTVSHV